MNDTDPTHREPLHPSEWARVDDACVRFEDAWKAGQRPRIQDYLGAATEPVRSHQLRYLLLIELPHRIARGETPTVQEYEGILPGHSSVIRHAFEELCSNRSREVNLANHPHEPGQPADSVATVHQTPSDTSYSLGRTADCREAREAGQEDFAERPEVFTGTPKRFGDYELIGEIARGGMGVVYKARQVTLNRTVAVKMILPSQLGGDTGVKRFRSEAEAAANLKHPNIVAIHEVGEHAGQHYFSMDYVQGQSLKSLVDASPLPAARAARYVEIVAEAIHYAHERGILHRDLKPSNILVDQFDRPQVTDFGLAKWIQGQGAGDLTATGSVLGTPSYMPPEQASEERGSIGPASDVYSLGATLYELLSGRPPFSAATPLDTVLQVLYQDPVPPRSLNPRIPLDLDTICLKCLDKEPCRRYASAHELAQDDQRRTDNSNREGVALVSAQSHDREPAQRSGRPHADRGHRRSHSGGTLRPARAP